MSRISSLFLLRAALLSLMVMAPFAAPLLSLSEHAGFQSTSSLQATETRRVNVPFFSGEVNWARTAIFWFGKNKQGVPSQNYTDVRVGYTAEALEVQVSVVDYYLWYDSSTDTGNLTRYDAVAIYLDTAHDQASDPQSDDYWFLVGARHYEDITNYMREARGNGGGWDTTWAPAAGAEWEAWSGMSWYCNPGPNSNTCGIDYGWTAIFTIPWETVGLSGPPADGALSGFGVQLYDRDAKPPAGYVSPTYWPESFSTEAPSTWGELAFDPPAYEPWPAVAEGTTTIRRGLNGTVEDAWMGGGGTCGGGHEGGSQVNHGDDTGLYTGSEVAVTHFPCFNKSYLRFSLDDVPPDKVIMSATLTLHLWGNAGDPGQAKASWVHLYTIADPWEEMTIHWNNAPLAQENVAVTRVQPYSSPGAIHWPGDPYAWDATQAVAEAYAAGQPLSVALYASDSEQHSSKYYTSSETGDWNAEGRPTLTITWGRALAEVEKSVTPAFGDQNDTLTYVLSFLGTGNTLSLTDTLSTDVSWENNVSWDGTTNPPTYDSGQHRLTWTGAPALGDEVTITYTVTINTGETKILENTAVILEEGGDSSTDSAFVIANPYVAYFPLTVKRR
jgi:hypothetical protein